MFSWCAPLFSLLLNKVQLPTRLIVQLTQAAHVTNVLPAYQVRAFRRADTDTIRAGAKSSTHSVYEHTAPTKRNESTRHQQAQGIYPLHPTCVCVYSVVFGSRFVTPSTTQGRGTWSCDKELEISLNKNPKAPTREFR